MQQNQDLDISNIVMTTYEEKVREPSRLLALAVASSIASMDVIIHSGQGSFGGFAFGLLLGVAIGKTYSNIQAIEHLSLFTMTNEQSDYLQSDCNKSLIQYSIAGALLPATTSIARTFNGNSNFL